MKKIILGVIVGLGVSLVIGAVSNVRFGLFGGFLQTDMDGNQKSETNLFSLSVGQSFLFTNALGLWPTQATLPGQAVFVNSNSVIYLITSSPGSTAWAATNKLAP